MIERITNLLSDSEKDFLGRIRGRLAVPCRTLSESDFGTAETLKKKGLLNEREITEERYFMPTGTALMIERKLNNTF